MVLFYSTWKHNEPYLFLNAHSLSYCELFICACYSKKNKKINLIQSVFHLARGQYLTKYLFKKIKNDILKGAVWNECTTVSLCDIKTYDMPQHPTHTRHNTHTVKRHLPINTHTHTHMNSGAHANTLKLQCVSYISKAAPFYATASLSQCKACICVVKSV